jgi:hypothetical protein
MSNSGADPIVLLDLKHKELQQTNIQLEIKLGQSIKLRQKYDELMGDLAQNDPEALADLLVKLKTSLGCINSCAQMVKDFGIIASTYTDRIVEFHNQIAPMKIKAGVESMGVESRIASFIKPSPVMQEVSDSNAKAAKAEKEAKDAVEAAKAAEEVRRQEVSKAAEEVRRQEVSKAAEEVRRQEESKAAAAEAEEGRRQEAESKAAAEAEEGRLQEAESKAAEEAEEGRRQDAEFKAKEVAAEEARKNVDATVAAAVAAAAEVEAEEARKQEAVIQAVEHDMEDSQSEQELGTYVALFMWICMSTNVLLFCDI